MVRSHDGAGVDMRDHFSFVAGRVPLSSLNATRFARLVRYMRDPGGAQEALARVLHSSTTISRCSTHCVRQSVLSMTTVTSLHGCSRESGALTLLITKESSRRLVLQWAPAVRAEPSPHAIVYALELCGNVSNVASRSQS
jgi:hypothetical protein